MHDVRISGNAIIGRDLNGQSSARFAIANSPTFDARIVRASAPKSFVQA